MLQYWQILTRFQNGFGVFLCFTVFYCVLQCFTVLYSVYGVLQCFTVFYGGFKGLVKLDLTHVSYFRHWNPTLEHLITAVTITEGKHKVNDKLSKYLKPFSVLL